MAQDPQNSKAPQAIAVTVLLAFGAYYVIRRAGHAPEKAIIASIVMLALGGTILLIHEAFGSKTGAAIMFALSFVLWIAMRFGYL